MNILDFAAALPDPRQQLKIRHNVNGNQECSDFGIQECSVFGNNRAVKTATMLQ
jgi:hypothetical protein